MLRGEHIRRKFYMRVAQGFLKTQQIAAFGLQVVKTKTRYLDVFKGCKEKASYRDGIQIFKSKKAITSNDYSG